MRILLVTQDRDARERMASAIGIEPQVLFADCAASGREALACLAARRPEVLFVRLPLPDMNSVEFVRAAKRLLARCPIVLIAPPGTQERRIAAIEARSPGWVP